VGFYAETFMTSKTFEIARDEEADKYELEVSSVDGDLAGWLAAAGFDKESDWAKSYLESRPIEMACSHCAEGYRYLVVAERIKDLEQKLDAALMREGKLLAALEKYPKDHNLFKEETPLTLEKKNIINSWHSTRREQSFARRRE
jgi:hypothetical protein